jgi:oligopeptide/dipeptide ABC transporter ATP-binding protein
MAELYLMAAGNVTGYRSTAPQKAELVRAERLVKYERDGAEGSHPPMQTLLEVQNLRVDYRGASGNFKPALCGVSFSLGAGEILGVLGESGCGKSTLAYSLLRLLASGGHLTGGSIRFDELEILNQTESALQRIRGSRIALIFQEASLALHPTMRIGEQVARVIGAHEHSNRFGRLAKARKALGEVFDEDTDRIFFSYPHQLSGGQRQRVLIAQAIACDPAILIADEPTASLDTTTQAEILSLFADLRKRRGMAIILITHNPAILLNFADRVMVLYAGRIVEEGSGEILLRSPNHPYLRGLMRSMVSSPEAALSLHKRRLPAIEGTAPDLSLKAMGCSFEPRCEDRMESCLKREPAITAIEQNRTVACFKFGGLEILSNAN